MASAVVALTAVAVTFFSTAIVLSVFNQLSIKARNSGFTRDILINKCPRFGMISTVVHFEPISETSGLTALDL